MSNKTEILQYKINGAKVAVEEFSALAVSLFTVSSAVIIGIFASYLLTPKLPNTYRHVFHNFSKVAKEKAADHFGIISQEFFHIQSFVVNHDVLAPISLISFLLMLFFSIKKKYSRFPLVSLLFFVFLSSALINSVMYLTSRNDSVHYASQVISASRLDVLSTKQALSPLQIRELTRDVHWMAETPAAMRTRNGVALVYSSHRLPKIIYRFSAPLPKRDMPSLAIQYMNCITASGGRQWLTVERYALYFDLPFIFLSGIFFVVGLFRKRNVSSAEELQSSFE